MKNLVIVTICLALSFAIWACNGEEEGLSEFERDHGIGPVSEKMELQEINSEKVETGQQIFQIQCEACHTLDARISGPALRNTVNRRGPEFVMNYILNPTVMSQQHPIGIELSEQYAGEMPENNLSMEEARAVLEYLRAADEGAL